MVTIPRAIVRREYWKADNLDGRQPLIEDKLKGTRRSTEDDVWYHPKFYRRQRLIKDDLWWKSTFDGGKLFIKEGLQWIKHFDGKWPLMNNEHWQKDCAMPRCHVSWLFPQYWSMCVQAWDGSLEIGVSSPGRTGGLPLPSASHR